MSEQSADRLTLILVKNPKLLMSSILKQFASCDPTMQEQGIAVEDVDKYMWANPPEYVGALQKLTTRNNKNTGATATTTG